MAAVAWNMEADYVQSCNCDFGCPCNFNGRPTPGNCEALVAYHIRRGEFAGTRLDGITFARLLWWPRAIHEGNGVSRVYVDRAASPQQVQAIEQIVSGKHGGGVWEVFAKTMAKELPIRQAKIDLSLDGYRSRFSVEGVGAVESDHILNPVTGAKFEGKVVLPNGINFKEAVVTRITSWWMRDEGLLARHENVAGFVAHTKYTQAGCHPP